MTGDRTTTDGSVGMEQAEGARNAPKTPPHEAVERLEELASMTTVNPTPLDAFCRRRATFGDLRTVLSHLRQVEEREAVMREALSAYHTALCRREHGGVAAGRFVEAAESLFGQTFDQHRSALTHSPETDGEG